MPKFKLLLDRFFGPRHIQDGIRYRTVTTVRKYRSDQAYLDGEDPYETNVHVGNCLLDAGITVALNLIGGIAATAFSNANAYIGIGDSATAAVHTQSNLLAATNKFYQAMAATYPSVAGAVISFQAVVTGANANYAWNEFVVANGSGGTTALNRVVSAQGTKTTGQTWTVTIQITLS